MKTIALWINVCEDDWTVKRAIIASNVAAKKSLPLPQNVNRPLIALADPGFSREGCANSQKCYYFTIFSQKLHENERIWTPGGARSPPWIRQ